jgi:hypothetical protein
MKSESPEPLFALTRIRLFTLVVLSSLGLFSTHSTYGQVALNFEYDGTDTVISYTVTADAFNGLSMFSSSEDLTSPSGTLAIDDTGSGNFPRFGAVSEVVDSYVGFGAQTDTADVPWSGIHNGGVAAGNAFFIENEVGTITAHVPADWDLIGGTSSALSGTLTFANNSLEDLGFSSGSNTGFQSGSFAMGALTINWSAQGLSAVPEPSTYAALFGVLALGLAIHRRRNTHKARIHS